MPAVATDDSGTWNDHAGMKTCTACGGEGTRTTKATDAKGNTVESSGPCNPCNGKGEVPKG